MESTTGKAAYAIGAQLFVLAISLLFIFLLVWAASKAWKKGQEASYMVGGGTKDQYGY